MHHLHAITTQVAAGFGLVNNACDVLDQIRIHVHVAQGSGLILRACKSRCKINGSSINGMLNRLYEYFFWRSHLSVEHYCGGIGAQICLT